MDLHSPQAANSLPQFSRSYWLDSEPPRTFPPLQEDIEVDYAIVGAGMTGVTLAYLLTAEGHRVALLEARDPVHGTTGHTTAKVTVQHDLIYHELAEHFGSAQARLYYQANEEALQFIKRTVAELRIDCGWAEEEAVLYAQTVEGARLLDQEYEACRRLGIPVEKTGEIPLPLRVEKALKLAGQAQFHPAAYMNALIGRITDAGGLIYGQTRIIGKVEEGERPVLNTTDGRRITCRHAVACSHFPFHDGLGLYFARLHPERSYIIAAKPAAAYPGGMYLSVDGPKRSLRSVMIDGEPMVLIGGDSHKTGQGDPTEEHYRNLEQFGRETLGIEAIPYRWSAQDLQTLDKLPYVGMLTSQHTNIWVATGFRKWGMTNGTAAALLLNDLLTGRPNAYSDLFAPSRFKIDPGMRNLIKENVNVAAQLIKGKFQSVSQEAERLGPDEGAVVQVKDGRAGAYRDADGVLHLVDTTCTHMGCELNWNGGERSWDCPCHGSRFDYKGNVLEGPAMRPLNKIEE
ncbi:Glycine/D-amino acid oxidase [Paenibacillus sp. UNCCL117]|uniref:FAD-dependent oxidoreductase n=1 Tax=unclassified Paenibacillus TaxID=185978 RepID=UPI00088974B0|nr:MULTISPECIES: FAD-dependent oxidoreductase [unclassified Paenibacillus]SDC64102.1 Glycine/D-amino acid oxidase [Paenibacillus sp. cl123]SFW22455.1 Glycine/D-amino acid oxidase [Paenibacillus sp. UNCCL117]